MRPELNNRSQSRSNVFLSASLLTGSGPLAVRVRNLSPAGALVDGGFLPPVGAAVRLVRGMLSAEGTIAWQSAGHAGIRFAARIDVAEWVKKTGHPGQQRVDDAIAALRRRDAPPVRMADNATPSLGSLSEELDQICERLAAMAPMTVELGEELVRLDALARRIQQLAGTVNG